MTSTGNLLTDILALYLPLALALIMGLLGLFRGVRREAVVSFSIVLAALIVSVWAPYWSSDLHDTFANFGRQETQTWLGVIVIGLVCLVIGYGLGSAITPHGTLTAMSRLGGLLIGLGNGAALGGWILRNYYNALQVDLSGPNANTFTAITDNVISRTLIIWAGWFPLVVALIAAIVALTGPFRRVQTVVATPPAQTNWTPSTAPAVAAAPAAATTAAYSQQYAQQYPQQQYGQPGQYAQQYPPQLGAQAQPPAAPPPQAAAAAYSPSSYVPPTTPYPSSQPTARVPDAPPTMPMPSSDLPPVTRGQDTVYMGGASGSPGLTPPTSPGSPASSASSSSPSPWSGPTASPGGSSRPDTGPLGDLPDDTQAKSSPPAWAQPPDSSWLSAPAIDTSSKSPTLDNSLLSRSEAPTMAHPTSTDESSSASSPALSSSPPALVNCSRCGALVPGDSMFCTECGNRLKT